MGLIDAARGAAALGVMIFHFTVRPKPLGPAGHRWAEFWSYGYLGVGMFFVISGYCITTTWLKQPNAGEFALRRLRRIFPAYWASLLLIVALAVACKAIGGINDVAAFPRTPGAVLATLTLFTDPVTSIPRINWVYWSLSYELAFYALMALLFIASRTLSVRVKMLAGVHIVLCAVSATGFAVHSPALFFADFWPLFGAGAALALRANFRLSADLMFLAAAAAAVFHRTPVPGVAYYLTAALTVVAIGAGSRLPTPRWLAPLREIGTFSYSLYLIHVPVGIYGWSRLFAGSSLGDFNYFSEQLGLIILTLGTTIAFYRVAERPFLHSREKKQLLPTPAPNGVRG